MDRWHFCVSPVSPCWLWLSDGLLGGAGRQRILNSIEPLTWGIGFLSHLLIPAASVTDLLLHGRWGSLLTHRWNEKRPAISKWCPPNHGTFFSPCHECSGTLSSLSHFFPQLYHLFLVFSPRPRDALDTQQICCLTNLQGKDSHLVNEKWRCWKPQNIVRIFLRISLPQPLREETPGVFPHGEGEVIIVCFSKYSPRGHTSLPVSPLY